MRRWIRRFFTLGLVGGGAAAAFKLKAKKSQGDSSAAEWPPFTPPSSAASGASNGTASTRASTDIDAAAAPAQGFVSMPPPATDATAATMAPPAGEATHGFADATAAAGVGQSWVAPVDGACPADHPVKANDDSGIFHVPGGRFYARTVAERCYTTAEAAVADGYRPAKV